MNREKQLIRKLGLQFAMAGAASAFLLVAPAYAQSESAGQAGGEQVTQAVQTEHKMLDENNDQKLQWDELEPRLEEAQATDDWGQDRVMSEFDQDNDDALNPQEYQLLLVEIDPEAAQQDQAQQEEQRRIELESADVEVQPGQPEVSVDQQPPEVQVEQAESDVTVDRQPPEVTVTQPPAEVTVTQPEPEVQVEIPEPEVEVSQTDPDVEVQQGQPNVQIEQQEPEVTVTPGQPEVDVEQPQQDVVLETEQPDVSMADTQQQADVQLEEDEQAAQVQVEQAEPDVEVTEAEPEVTVESTDTANVEVQRPGEEQEGQEQEQAQPEQPEQDMAQQQPEEMDAPAAGIPPVEQQAQREGQQGLDQMSIDELEGMTVTNSQGEELGSIDQVVVAQDQNQPAVLLTVGGLLGIGADEILIPMEELSLTQDGQLQWEQGMSTRELRQSEQYQAENYTRASSENYSTISELKQSIQQ